MLKKKLFIIATLLCIFIPPYAFSYDVGVTGIWNFTEHTPWTNCPIEYIPQSGQFGALQTTENTFLIVFGDWSAEGTLSGTTYTVTDSWCEDSGTVSEVVTINLTSDTTANGYVSWVYTQSSPYYTCSGGHQTILNKQPQAAPVYDATGTWSFLQSGVNNCSGTPPPSSGSLIVTQTGNKITAVDNLGQQYNGFVNGYQYSLIRSYLQAGSRTTEWSLITLSSETQGAGTVEFVWDDSCSECWGDWNISMTKEVTQVIFTITATASAGGTISPKGEVAVPAGESQGFQITADPSYVISDVLVDSASVGAVSSYTFTDVSADHTINVVFKHIPFLSFLSLLLE